MISKILKSDIGRFIISAILGLGLASLFRRACIGDNCVIIKSPPNNNIQNKTFKYGNKCVKYTPKIHKCSKK